MKLPPANRRNYRHALDGLIRVAREEGVRKLFGGAEWASSRAVLLTVGQLSFYDLIKAKLLETRNRIHQCSAANKLHSKLRLKFKLQAKLKL
jgi:hypothetical protein